MTAEKIGLVVITFERYFKTVHAIAHRNYYRNWMTSLGVVVPWIAGFCTFAIPAIVSTRAVPGHCPIMGFWPSEDFQTAYATFDFLWNYALPVGVFVYCYSRIFHTIRHQSKVVSSHVGRGQNIAMTTTSRDQNAGQIQQQATGTTTSTKLSHTELNILQAMITVIICFILCWSPSSLTSVILSLKGRSLSIEWFDTFVSVGFVNLCINPLIYAARYEVFRKSLRRMLKKDNVASAIAMPTV